MPRPSAVRAPARRPRQIAGTSNDIIAAFQAIPPAQRGMSVKAAFYRYMDKRFPCR